MGREDELSGTIMFSRSRRCRTCIPYLAGWEQEEVQTDRQLPRKWQGTHRMEGETHTPPKGRAQGREAYDFITGPTPMTSPGGRGARPTSYLWKRAGGQAQIQILNRFRCGWIQLPAGPVGPPRPAGRQAGQEGGRLEVSS